MDAPKTWDALWETLPGNGWLTKDEGELLYRVAGSCDGPILEVGCYKGKSTCLLASLGRAMYVVDPFKGFDSDDPSGEGIKKDFIATVTEKGHIVFDALTWGIRGCNYVYLFAQSISEWIPRPCGFAYLDGDHTYDGTAEQLAAAEYAGVKDVCVHDFTDNGDGAEIKRAVKDEGWTVIERVERMAHCRRKGKS